ncbi:MAG: glycosyl transferase [Candidatus Aminicenantes bacterium RBG_19FT_COMBO_58_17]|nr:MAG: glycosyl transferase [Candidatus Aminicenantes bacterium RBG_19FT_COMBO_58_17]
MTYVLITPARNEGVYIEQTIQAVIHQTVKPAKWVIVSDGSTDGTDEIVNEYVREHPWMELVRMPERAERHFEGKAIAFNAGRDRLRNVAYDIIGNLDADITFDEDHFDYLLNKFARDKTLGVAGTPFREGNTQYDYRFSRKEHVSGACQLFRRECFETIGGYVPLKGGGIDLIAVVTARMRGWKTETFTEKACLHLRPMGKAGSHYLKYTFKSGHGDYMLGVHPVWQFFRSIYQMGAKPLFMSGFLLLSGYFWGMIIHPPKPVSEEFVRFRRKEQMRWLKDYFRNASARLN